MNTWQIRKRVIALKRPRTDGEMDIKELFDIQTPEMFTYVTCVRTEHQVDYFGGLRLSKSPKDCDLGPMLIEECTPTTTNQRE